MNYSYKYVITTLSYQPDLRLKWKSKTKVLYNTRVMHVENNTFSMILIDILLQLLFPLNRSAI